MDLISNMLSTLRLDASVFLHASFCQDWVIDINDFDVGTFHLIAHGNCWLHLPKRDAIALHERDLVVLPHNAPHYITNSPSTPDPNVARNTPATEISGPSVSLVCGQMCFSQAYWNPLVEALPEYIILSTLESRDTTLGNVIEALILETERSDAGGEVIIDRLCDILFIEVLRIYVGREHGDSYLVAVRDPKMSRALEAFHSDPGRNWSVQELADCACMSRSAFAERFVQLVAMAPMHYVTRWRMQFAHHRLTAGEEPIGEIAAACGYHSEESFAKAFRREFGAGPAAIRRREPASTILDAITVRGETGISTKILYDPLEANRLRLAGEVTFIDVRDAGQYARGHIPGAINMPELFYMLSTTTREGLREMEANLSTMFARAGVVGDKTTLFYEDDLDTQYGASCRGYFQLMYLGHPNGGVLNGGLKRWCREGFPVDQTPAAVRPGHWNTTPNRECLATLDDVLLAVEHQQIKLLDNRDKEEWLGINCAPPAFYREDFLPRKGRIPGARWIEWRNFLEDKDGSKQFKTAEQIRSICAQAGLYPDDDIIVYCFKGARAANTQVALKLAGFKRVRNYYGSWNEWARDAALPAMASRLFA
jgi:thiosulfate/3-mercaptopyruvate sulfurtransferase